MNILVEILKVIKFDFYIFQKIPREIFLKKIKPRSEKTPKKLKNSSISRLAGFSS